MKTFAVVLFTLILAAPVFSGSINLTGTWEGPTEVDGNSIDTSLVLKKEGDIYVGSITVAEFADNEEIRDVEFKDNKLSFSFTVYNGDEYLGVKINFSVSENSMTGEWESEDGNSGDIIMEKVSS